MKKLKHSLLFLSLSLLVTFTASASSNTCSSKQVKTLSEIARKYNVSISEIKAACANVNSLTCNGNKVTISGNCSEILNSIFNRPENGSDNNSNTDDIVSDTKPDSDVNTDTNSDSEISADNNSDINSDLQQGSSSDSNSQNNGTGNNMPDNTIESNDSDNNNTEEEAEDKNREFEKEVVRLVNEIRVENGLSVLTENRELSRIARLKSEDMYINNYFSHISPTYGSPFDMMKNFGISYTAAAENIAKGQVTPSQVVNAWMNSSGHRANILNASYTQIGVGYCENGNVWTQMFIK